MAPQNDNSFANKLKRRLKPRAPRHLAAVDFDSTSVRIVHARRTGAATRIDTLYTSPVPAELDLDDAQAVGEFLGRTLKEFSRETRTSLHGCGVLMSVPRQKAVLKPLTLPPGTVPDEMAAMIRFQVEKDLPFGLDQSVIDFTVTSHLNPSGSTNGVDQNAGVGVLVGAVSIEVVEHYRRIAEAAGVKLRRQTGGRIAEQLGKLEPWFAP